MTDINKIPPVTERGQIGIGDLLPAREAVPTAGYDDSGALINPATEAERRLDAIAWQINLRENQAKAVFKQTALEIGEYLIEAQQLCPRGRWGEWLRSKIDYSERKAQQLMQVYEGYRDKQLTGDYEQLSFTQIYQLLSAPEDSRDELARRAAEESLSTRQLRAEIDRLKAEAEDRQQRMEIETAEAYHDGMRNGAEEAGKEVDALKARAEAAEAKAQAAEASMGTIRDTAAKANDRAADAEKELRQANKAFEERSNELKEQRTKNAALMEELAKSEADRAKLAAENRKLREAAPPSMPAPTDLDALMDAVKGSLMRMVTAIKEAREARPSEADAKKNELMVICTAITKKLGGNTNAEN